ncbi:formyl transferase [Candidatus Woesearchaeota archaeon]|nr:formyl transferase [Candidatus Woesearchaeota archaeon]
MAIIGRTEILLKTAKLLISKGYSIPLIVTTKEAPEYSESANFFRDFADEINAVYIYSSKLDSHCHDIESLDVIDIAISLNYSSIISQKIIDIFPMGVLNAHGGDLPKYRGNACQAWAIINGEDRIGLCIHSMIGGEVDSGNIIDREYLNIDVTTKITSVYQWFDGLIPIMFLRSVQKLKKDKNYVLERQSKDSVDALRCYPRISGDGRIDWNKSNIEILRLINASNKPYSGAFCFYKDKKIIIWDAKLLNDNELYLAQAGQISNINSDGSIVVITGNGKLAINKVEYRDFFGKPSKIIKSIRSRLV